MFDVKKNNMLSVYIVVKINFLSPTLILYTHFLAILRYLCFCHLHLQSVVPQNMAYFEVIIAHARIQS